MRCLIHEVDVTVLLHILMTHARDFFFFSDYLAPPLHVTGHPFLVSYLGKTKETTISDWDTVTILLANKYHFF